MRAARWHARRDVRVDDVAMPVPLPGEVLLDVAWAGICGTDLEEYLDGPHIIPVDTSNPVTGRRAPITLGHEFAGRVRALGPGVGRLEVGERVAVEMALACGTCAYCRAGTSALCLDFAAYGLMTDGGLAESVAVLAESCVPMPTSIDDRSAALIEPSEVAVRAVRKLHPRAGESAAVLGGGTIGLMAAQVLRVAGVDPVLVVTGHPAGREVARELDLQVVDSAEPGWREEVRARTGGLGPHLVVESQGRRESALEAARLARREGRVVLVGIVPSDVPIDLLDLIFGEKVLIGSVQHERDADLLPALELLASGAIRATPLITAEVDLDRVVPDGFEILAAPDRRQVKVLVRTA